MHVVAHVLRSGDNFLESLLTKLLFLKDLPVSAAALEVRILQMCIILSGFLYKFQGSNSGHILHNKHFY